MPVLGSGGRLALKRQVVNKTTVLSQSGLDTACNRIAGGPSWIWNGDKIQVDNLPIYGEGGVPGRVGGFATYFGSKWYLGPNRQQITSATDKFYKTSSEAYPPDRFGGDSNFYAKNGADPVPSDNGANGTYWAHIDAAGFISFYTSRCAALSGCRQDRIQLAPLSGDITLNTLGTTDYQNAKWECYNGPCDGATSDYWYSNIVDDDDPADSICRHAPGYALPAASTGDYNNADVSRTGDDLPAWQIIAGLREYSLELKGDSIDTTSVSEKFGTAVKSLVSGGGSLEFFIDRTCGDDTTDNSLMIMQLLLMTERGCEADAEFWLTNEPVNCGAVCDGQIGGGLYYKAKILITSTAINLRPTELVAGTANFVTTEEIRLQQAI